MDDLATVNFVTYIFGPAQPETLKKGNQFGQHDEEITDICKMIKTKN